MKNKIKRTAIIVAGILLMLLGILGLALPFLHGFLFLAMGLILLSISSPAIATWMESHTRRYPKIHKVVARLDRWIRRTVGPLD